MGRGNSRLVCSLSLSTVRGVGLSLSLSIFIYLFIYLYIEIETGVPGGLVMAAIDPAPLTFSRHIFLSFKKDFLCVCVVFRGKEQEMKEDDT